MLVFGGVTVESESVKFVISRQVILMEMNISGYPVDTEKMVWISYGIFFIVSHTINV